MLTLIRKQLNKTGNVTRSTYLWNTINAGLSAALCPVILMVMTRTNGVNDAGVFSIAFAVAALMLFIGQYGIRRYQASDIHEKYSFAEYHGMRFITCGAMLLASIAYCVYGLVFKDYGPEKFTVVMLICILKLIQAYADVIHGHMQQKGRLDAAAKASAARFLAELVSCCVALIITRDLVISSVVCVLTSLTVLMLTTMNVAGEYCGSMKPSITANKLKWLLIEGFPIFVSLFLNMYISNAPKYAIDTYLTDEVQAYFNYIFMPAFVIQLIAYFIFNPILTTYAKLWLSDDPTDFRRLMKLIRRQCLILLGLTALAVLVALTIGIPVLSFMFGVDLGDYKKELVILMIGGGMMAYGVFFSTVITIIREQKYLLIGYGVASLAALVLSGQFVAKGGMMGASILYAVLMALVSILLGLVTFWKIHASRGREG